MTSNGLDKLLFDTCVRNIIFDVIANFVKAIVNIAIKVKGVPHCNL